MTATIHHLAHYRPAPHVRPFERSRWLAQVATLTSATMDARMAAVTELIDTCPSHQVADWQEYGRMLLGDVAAGNGGAA